MKGNRESRPFGSGRPRLPGGMVFRPFPVILMTLFASGVDIESASNTGAKDTEVRTECFHTTISSKVRSNHCHHRPHSSSPVACERCGQP